MNHRKLHLLKPTVYTYCHSNFQLVKTELIDCRLSPALNTAASASPACHASPVEQRDGEHCKPCVFSPLSLPVRKSEFLQYNSDHHLVLSVRRR